MVAALAASLYASLHIAFKAKDSALRALEPVRRCEAAFNLIKDDIQSAAGPKGLLAGEFVGAKAASGQGNQNDSLSFYAAATDIEADTGVGDIKKVDLLCAASDDSSGDVLIRQVTTNLLATTTAEPRQEVVCRGVRTFALRYFDGSSWQDSWDSTALGDILPMAVEVMIELNAPAGSPPDVAGYRMSRVFLVPCGQAATDAASTDAETSSPNAP
jgi:hypothetical protein